jgi:nucleoid DNA-binding protein
VLDYVRTSAGSLAIHLEIMIECESVDRSNAQNRQGSFDETACPGLRLLTVSLDSPYSWIVFNRPPLRSALTRETPIVTKKEIVKAISDELGLTQLTTKEIVQKTFDAIVETLVEDRRIELRNFGVFEVKMRAARKARNPRTGGQVEVPAKFVVTFKPGKEMEAKVRELEEREAARSKAAAEAAASGKISPMAPNRFETDPLSSRPAGAMNSAFYDGSK